MEASKVNTSKQLIKISRYFLKIGLLGFGGPLSLLTIFQKDCIEKLKWISKIRFDNALSILKAMPGPVSSQIAIFIGYEKGGRLGGFLAGICLIFPAFCMMIFLGKFHPAMEKLPWIQSILFGIQAASIGIIFDGIRRIASVNLKNKQFLLLVCISIALTATHPTLEPFVIIGFGLIGISHQKKTIQWIISSIILLLFFWPNLFSNQTEFKIFSLSEFSLHAQILALFLKAGAFTFGTGIAVIPLLAHDVVDRLHWLTTSQFMDALAFGQMTPGPIFITATFIGYKVAGLWGATLATFGVFAPSFFNVLTWFPQVLNRLHAHPSIQKFIFWAIAAVTGTLIFSLTKLVYYPIQSQKSNLEIILFYILSIFSAYLSFRSKIQTWLIFIFSGLISFLFLLNK